MKKFAVTLVLALAPIAAIGSTIIGNPTSSVILVDGNDVYVESVRANNCFGSGYDLVSVDETLDQWESSTITFDTGIYCDVIVKVRWAPEESITSVYASGFTTFVVDSSGDIVAIELDASSETAVLN